MFLHMAWAATGSPYKNAMDTIIQMRDIMHRSSAVGGCPSRRMHCMTCHSRRLPGMEPYSRASRVRFNNCMYDSRGSSEGSSVLSRRNSLVCMLLSLQGTFAWADDDARLDQVTQRVYLDVGICRDGLKKDRRLGDTSILCDAPDPLGRIVIDLYGNAAPGTVKNFVRLVESGALENTVVNKVFPGRYIAAGQQGAHRMGLMEAPELLEANGDLLNSSSFRLKHERPGTVSLMLRNNIDEEYIRDRKGYKELSFLITTGPGPVPSLDDENIVFGRVSEGFDVVGRIAEAPTFKQNESLRVFSDLAKVIGDDRVTKKASTFGKPLVPIVFVKTGVLE